MSLVNVARVPGVWLVALVVACAACEDNPSRLAKDGRGPDILADVGGAREAIAGRDAGKGRDAVQAADTLADTRTGDAGGKPADGKSPTGTIIPKAYITGYSWYDNTPPGSATISHPQIHQTAGGTGTWADPITVAVGHDLSSGKDVLDYPAGTRFYVPDFQRYFIVEDTCGDGPTPENGPCHVPPPGATTWLDVWIGGESGTKASTDACMNKLTGIHQVVLNPDPYRAVSPGAIFSNGACQV